MANFRWALPQGNIGDALDCFMVVVPFGLWLTMLENFYSEATNGFNHQLNLQLKMGHRPFCDALKLLARSLTTSLFTAVMECHH
jgi:hypothetical protein